MKPNVWRSYMSLPPKEKKAIDEALAKLCDDKVNHEEAELQKIWIQLACIELSDPYFEMTPDKLIVFIGGWKRIYRYIAKLGSKEAQDEYLNSEMERIFGKDGYPYEFIDSLEKRG